MHDRISDGYAQDDQAERQLRNISNGRENESINDNEGHECVTAHHGEQSSARNQVLSLHTHVAYGPDQRVFARRIAKDRRTALIMAAIEP